MVSWFEATQSYYNKKNSFLQMIKIVGNCELETATKFYNEYSRTSYWQRISISRDLRKRHHEIVYGDRKQNQFFTGINKSAPYPLFPVTNFLSKQGLNIPLTTPELVAKINAQTYDELEEEIEFIDSEEAWKIINNDE